jgi:hypothetical protein
LSGSYIIYDQDDAFKCIDCPAGKMSCLF